MKKMKFYDKNNEKQSLSLASTSEHALNSFENLYSKLNTLLCRDSIPEQIRGRLEKQSESFVYLKTKLDEKNIPIECIYEFGLGIRYYGFYAVTIEYQGKKYDIVFGPFPQLLHIQKEVTQEYEVNTALLTVLEVIFGTEFVRPVFVEKDVNPNNIAFAEITNDVFYGILPAE